MQTLFIGQSLFFLNEVESTNTYASDLLKNVNPPEGAIVYTDNQTQGRGQRGTIWRSAVAENVTMSVILKPNFLAIKDSFYLSKITALAVYDLMAERLTNGQYDIKIKWPNDILVNQKKIAGILIENTVHNNHIQNSIIGVGLNINQYEFGELESSATSIKKLTTTEYDRQVVMSHFCEKLEKWYLKLKLRKFDFIDESYIQLIFKLNMTCEFIEHTTSNRFNAILTGVARDGKLELIKSNGLKYYYDLKEVKLIF